MPTTRRLGALPMELDSARATIVWGECVIRNFTDRVCEDYESLACAQSTSYRDCLSAVFADAQLKGDYLGWFRVWVSENGQSVYIGDTDSYKKREARTPHSGADGGDVEVVPPLAGLS